MMNNSLDQFYTNDDVARSCYDIFRTLISFDNIDTILEPSAGKGAFYKLLPYGKRIGLDIEPKCDGVVKMDFFEFRPNVNSKYAIIGNPPFGKMSSMAIKFFNKCAEFAEVIAFIVPRTFKRVSVQNQLNPNFHLQHNTDLSVVPCCFTPKMNAKCCFQIWKKSNKIRDLIKYDKTHSDFTFLKYGPKDDKNQPTPPENADFAIKAYGSNCGEIVSVDLHVLRPKSWHWIKCNIDIDVLKERFEQLDYSISKDTVRQDSIGQQELIYIYKCKFG